MYHKSNKQLTKYSQDLRKAMTKEERHLWYDFFKTQKFKTHRQYVISPYIADFYIPSVKRIIELDGSQHYEEDGEKYDLSRDNYLKEKGIIVLRYSNYDVNSNFEGVCEDILNNIERRKEEFS